MSAFGFWVRNGHISLYRSLYRSLNTNSASGGDQFNLEKYLGVSDLSGMSVSSIFILRSETDQQNYLYVSTCHNFQKVHMYNANINEKPCFDRFLSVLARNDILLNNFHDASDAFRCIL